MKEIYQALKQQLLLVTDQEDNHIIKHVALWNRQTEFLEKETPFDVPAVFIEFGKVLWKHQLQGVQDTVLPITLHIVTPYAPEGYDGSLFHLEICEYINKALHGFSVGWHTGAFLRVDTEPCHDHEQLLLTRESYATLLTDHSAKKESAVAHHVQPQIVVAR